MNRPRTNARTAILRNFLSLGLVGCALMLSSASASPNLDLARQLNQAFIEVAEKVSPAVVVITVTTKPAKDEPADAEPDAENSFPNEFWREFHRQFREGSPREKEIGQGSGVIVRKDGFILTNRHVVDDAETIEVRLKDGRTFKAKVRGVDPQSDLAVIQIETNKLPVAKFADSASTRVGEFAIAIGAPFQLDYSVTIGHVSAKGRGNVVPRFRGGGGLVPGFIQTGAHKKTGHTGGARGKKDGEVIGIITLIRGLRTGIGFAIPSSLAREVADQIIAHGKFPRPWLGVSIHTLREDETMREQAKGLADGVVVNRIMPDGPAAQSELRARDIITAVDGQRVNTVQELRNEIRRKKIGQAVTLDVWRKSKTLKVEVKPGEWVDGPSKDRRPAP